MTSLVNVFRDQGYEGDLKSSSNVALVLSKLPPDLKTKWQHYLVEQEIDTPSLIKLEGWLSRQAEAHENMLAMSNPAPSNPNRTFGNQEPQTRMFTTNTTSYKDKTSFQTI